MTNEQFNQVKQKMDAHINQLLRTKQAEYSPGTDEKFKNFIKAAAITGEEPVSMAWKYTIKHLCSVSEMIEMANDGHYDSLSKWEEKLGDIITYCYLMYGMVTEKTNGEDNLS